jgi:hypothetical protein
VSARIITMRATPSQVKALEPFVEAARKKSTHESGFVIFGQAYLLGSDWDWRGGIEFRFTILSREAAEIIQRAIVRARRLDDGPKAKP